MISWKRKCSFLCSYSNTQVDGDSPIFNMWFLRLSWMLTPRTVREKEMSIALRTRPGSGQHIFSHLVMWLGMESVFCAQK